MLLIESEDEAGDSVERGMTFAAFSSARAGSGATIPPSSTQWAGNN